jgi:hypothetical protein
MLAAGTWDLSPDAGLERCNPEISERDSSSSSRGNAGGEESLPNPYFVLPGSGERQALPIISSSLKQVHILISDPSCPPGTASRSPWASFGRTTDRGVALTMADVDVPRYQDAASRMSLQDVD